MKASEFLILFALLVPLVLNLGFTKVILLVSHKFGWYDSNDPRKVHKGDVPRLGGLGVAFSYLITVIICLLVAQDLSISLRITILLCGMMLICFIGLIDDFRNIPALWKLLGQISVAVLAIAGGMTIPGIAAFGKVISFGSLAIPLTILWFIAISNAVNLIDGIDGLAGGTSLLSAVFIGVIHLALGNTTGATLSFALVGALLGFLYYNRPKARIFMGDSGSLFIGFTLAALMFVGVPRGSGFEFSGIVVSLTVLIIPVSDMMVAILRRLRKGAHIFSPDREHLHHKLLDFGFSTARILALMFTWAILAGAAGVFWALASTSSQIPGWLADLTLIGVWIASFVVHLVVHLNYRRKRTEITH